jgi:hypothetical protein
VDRNNESSRLIGARVCDPQLRSIAERCPSSRTDALTCDVPAARKAASRVRRRRLAVDVAVRMRSRNSRPLPCSGVAAAHRAALLPPRSIRRQSDHSPTTACTHPIHSSLSPGERASSTRH